MGNFTSDNIDSSTNSENLINEYIPHKKTKEKKTDECVILLCGTGDSGKTTFFNQIKYNMEDINEIIDENSSTEEYEEEKRIVQTIHVYHNITSK
jgi:GTPase SAR1 family protein